jgi:hypothetical protein
VFAAKPGVAERTAELARREALCCPFASYQVTVEGEHVVWRTSSQAGPVAQAILDEFYGLPEQMGKGMDGLLARLRSVASQSLRRLRAATGSRRATGRPGCWRD